MSNDTKREYGRVGHEKDFGMYIFAAYCCHNMIDKPKDQWAGIYSTLTTDTKHDRKKLKELTWGYIQDAVKHGS